MRCPTALPLLSPLLSLPGRSEHRLWGDAESSITSSLSAKRMNHQLESSTPSTSDKSSHCSIDFFKAIVVVHSCFAARCSRAATRHGRAASRQGDKTGATIAAPRCTDTKPAHLCVTPCRSRRARHRSRRQPSIKVSKSRRRLVKVMQHTDDIC